MKVAVLGAKSTALAAAFDWSQAGHDVFLFDFPNEDDTISAVTEAGGVYSVGELNGFQAVKYVGVDIKEILSGAQLVIVAGQADRLALYGQVCAPYTEAGQIFLVISCGGMSALAFKNALGLAYDDPRVTVAETHTSPYFSRAIGPGRITVFYRLPAACKVAALPREGVDRVLEALSPVLPCVEKAASVLETTLQDCGPSTQSVITVMNAPRIERTGGDFYFFRDGMTPSVAGIIRTVDRERIAIGRALGLQIEDAVSLGIHQGVFGPDVDYLSGYSQSPELDGFMAQPELSDGFYTTDIGYTMVFWIDLAKKLGVGVPMMSAIETLASGIMQRDFLNESPRTLEKLGIADFSIEELKKL